MTNPFNFELLENWRTVLFKAWSVRLGSLAAVFGAIELAMPFFEPVFRPGTFALLSALTALGGVVARIYKQRNMVDVDPDEADSQ